MKKWMAAAAWLCAGALFLSPAQIRAQETQTEENAQEVKLRVDVSHAYADMERAFSDGYVPRVENDTVYLSVPFVADGELSSSGLTVWADTGSGEETPFAAQNYRKTVLPETYTFGEVSVSAYLYTIELKLAKERSAGVCAITVNAEGEDLHGNPVSYQFCVNADIPAGEAAEEPGGAGEPELSESGEVFAQSAPAPAASEEKEELIRQPRLLLKSCDLSGETLAAGEERAVSLTFQNASAEQPVYNLKISAVSADAVLILEELSAYYEKVVPGQEITWEQKLSVSQDAQQQAYPLEFQFEYEDEKGTAYTGSEKTYLQVRQNTDVSAEGFSLPETVYASDILAQTIQIVNTGRAPVYNVKVTAGGAGIFAAADAALGTIAAGESREGSLRLYVGTKDMETKGQETDGSDMEKYGGTEVQLTVTYEDAFGQPYTKTFAYQTAIEKPRKISFRAKEEKPETNQWQIAAAAGAFLVLLSALGASALRIRTLKNRLSDKLAAQKEEGCDENGELF